MAYPAFTNLAAAIWPDASETDKEDVRIYGGELEAYLNAVLSDFPLVNGQLTVTVAANSLVIALKTLAGQNPSATDPVYFIVRGVTAANADFARIAITAAVSLTISAGSTLGGFTQGALRLVGFNDAGTFRFGLINLFASGVRYAIPSRGIGSATADDGAGGSDSAGVFYSDAAVTSKAFRHLATLRWNTALGSTGLWSSAPDVVILEGNGGTPPNIVPQGHLRGLTLSNNGSDANNDIDIAAGEAAPEGDLGLMILSATLTKRSDAAWAVGSGNGGMDTGSKANSSWGYVWLIGRTDTGVIDALFSASATAPTMPTGYDQKRRIGAVYFGASTAPISAFVQDGDEFTLSVPVNDASTTNPGTSAVLRTLSVPPGMRARFNYFLNNVTTATVYVLITEVAQTDTTPTATLHELRTSATGQVVMGEFRRRADSSSQIRFRHHASGASDALVLTTKGWTDTRGRNVA